MKEEPADTGYNEQFDEYQGVNVKQEKIEDENGAQNEEYDAGY